MSSSQEFESYVPVYDVVPTEWTDAQPFITEQLKKISNAVNFREIGFFLDQEVLTGKAFIPGVTIPGNNPTVYRSILRKVINFGTLPNATTKTVAHGLIVDANFTLIEMYISATDPVAFKGFSLQYWAKNTPGDIILSYDATNVIVTTASSYTNFTRSFVVLEYIQEL